MIGRIVEIAEDKRYIFVLRGFMVVQDTEGEKAQLGRIPLDDILAVIANAHGLIYSNSLLVALAERGIPFVLCSANHNACGMLLPIDGNFEQGKRMDAQIIASKPMMKKLWAEIVRSKLEQQAVALTAAGKPAVPLTALAKRVKSGDPENLEAQGARRYWGLLFGEQFRRDQAAPGINSLLNYGYTVFRAAAARAVVAAGLHPSLGLHHSHANNPMRLVDDLIEPFRPIIDLRVWRLQLEGHNTLTPEVKKQLVQTLFVDLHSDDGATPVCVAMQSLATSLAQVFINARSKLDLPRPGLPLLIAAASAID